MQHICHCSSSWVSKIGTSTYHAFIFMFVPQMEVSINGGTPEWMVYNRTSYIYILKWIIWGYTIIRKLHFWDNPINVFWGTSISCGPCALVIRNGFVSKTTEYPQNPLVYHHFPIESAIYIYIYPGWWFQPLWKIWKSVGMMKFPIYGTIKMFQTTNQYHIYHKLSRIFRHTHMDPFHIISSLQWEFQDPKVEVLYHRRPYFVGIFPNIG